MPRAVGTPLEFFYEASPLEKGVYEGRCMGWGFP